jgi:hypothetical protein
MRFANVDQEELGPVLIGVIDAFQVASLATEGRSGIAAEDKDDGLLALELR